MGSVCGKCMNKPKKTKDSPKSQNQKLVGRDEAVETREASHDPNSIVAAGSREKPSKLQLHTPPNEAADQSDEGGIAEAKRAKQLSMDATVESLNSKLSSVQNMVIKGNQPNLSLNATGWTLLHVAAQTGNEDLASTLLDKGADPNLQEDNEDWTPLHIAALNGNINIVRLLLKKGANRFIVDRVGLTPEQLAVKYHMRNIPAVFAEEIEEQKGGSAGI